jgi:xanthine/CO dehydrogenase XdhC/CoxF family maturation factor
MKELAEIIRLESKLHASNVDAALATVVRVQGSSYRRPGARMLISGDGQFTGGVSGGCLERDIIIRAGGVMETRRPLMLRYDTAADFEGGAGSGYSLGCGGTIDVLIEPLRTPAGMKLVDWLKASQTAWHALATVVSKQHAMGSRMAVLEAGRIDGHILNAETTNSIAAQAQLAMMDDRSRLVQVESESGTLDVFIEVLNPPLSLIIFGAGNDVVPLVGFAEALGWRVTVVDVRSSPLDLGRTWKVERYIRCAVSDVADHVGVDQTSATVVMTHNFDHDRRIIEWLAPMNLRYLGLLGPRHRTEQLLGDLQAENLHSPVGLDLGANNPEEVALAIVSEITAVLRGRAGGPLSSSNGPIHSGEDHARSGPAQPRSVESNSVNEVAACAVVGS